MYLRMSWMSLVQIFFLRSASSSFFLFLTKWTLQWIIDDFLYSKIGRLYISIVFNCSLLQWLMQAQMRMNGYLLKQNLKISWVCCWLLIRHVRLSFSPSQVFPLYEIVFDLYTCLFHDFTDLSIETLATCF